MIVRREFIKKLVFGAISLPLLAHFWPEWRGNKIPVFENIISSENNNFKIFFEGDLYKFNERSFMASFVQDYLNERSHLRRPAALLETVSQRVGDTPPYNPDQIASYIREDFAADHIVTYKGWVFADMEAQLCALTLLSHDSLTGRG